MTFPSFDSGLDNGFSYPDLAPPSTGFSSPFDTAPTQPTDNPMQGLEDYRQRWFEENEQSLDDWEYFYYGIPAGNEVFLGLGD